MSQKIKIYARKNTISEILEKSSLGFFLNHEHQGRTMNDTSAHFVPFEIYLKDEHISKEKKVQEEIAMKKIRCVFGKK